jgi:type I restriction-modification system DNA methylase subunit
MSQATLGSTPYQNSSLFSGYYLDERVYDLDGWDCDEEAQQAFEDLQTLWDIERTVVESHNETELLDSWIDEVLDVLGFSTLSEETLPSGGGFTDRLLFESGEDRVDAIERREDGDIEGTFNLASAVLEAKQWNTDFTKRFSEQRSYRDASHQIKYYLEQSSENLQWGVLTDGRKWRLYGTKDYATEIYYEVDLPELLDSGTLEQFKYFYAFFRPEAFHETAGTSFLDTVWNESETAAQELGEDLQDNVFTALRVLGEGFIHQNDLDIDPDDEDARAELKEQSLVLLYRLMFVLYAESRGLIRPDDEAARDEYEEHFSLDQLRAEIHEAIQEGDTYEDYSGYSTKMWSQLQNLFELVDEGNEDLDIPPYNGGLFDDDEHEFIAENEVADRHIAEVIHRLGTTIDEDGDYVLADYADLDTRHLGSIYEGLLEHEFRIADEQYAAVSEDGGQVWKPATEVSVADAVETVEEGELYVVNDDGERKATGAYYTPDYVVSYIVEETVDPLLDDIKAELEADGLEPSEPEYFRRFWQSVKDLEILDPAMGSAHFLTSATGYLTEQVMEVVREQEIQGYDEQHLRREIAKECIYGVDINGMAVELGKLSMWLETLAADQPLAFLDHHLKDGNSLVGSDITEVLSDDVDDEGGQLTLMQAAARARKNTLEHVMDLMQELLAIDNETLDDIKSMEDLYDEIRDDPLYQRLFEIANVHTAEEFGLDVPEGVYEEMAGAIEDEDEWAEIRERDWFASAQAVADKEDFFHWELEYPEVFFGEDGEKQKDAGFDAVVGNPPYIRVQNIQKEVKEYLKNSYHSASGKFDIYLPFLEKSIDMAKPRGYAGMIIPSKFKSTRYGEKIKDYLAENGALRSYIDFSDYQIFPEVTTYTCIPIFQKSVEFSAFEYAKITSEVSNQLASPSYVEAPPEAFLAKSDEFFTVEEADLKDRLVSVGMPLETVTKRIFTGIQTSVDEYYVLTGDEVDALNLESDYLQPFIRGEHVRRWNVDYEEEYVIYPEEIRDGDVHAVPPERLQTECPNLWDYLNRDEVKSACTSRDYLMKQVESGGMDEWYEVWMRRNPQWFNEEKILTPALSGEANFVVDDGEFHFTSGTAGVYGIMLNEEIDSVESRYYITALLNTRVLDWLVQMTSPIYRGSYYKYNTQYLEDLPILLDTDAKADIAAISQDLHDRKEEMGNEVSSFLNWIQREWNVDIEDLSRKTYLREYWQYDFDGDKGILQIAKDNSSAIDKDPTSRTFQEKLLKEWESSVEEISQLTSEIEEGERRIEDRVREIYGLTEDEARLIDQHFDE